MKILEVEVLFEGQHHNFLNQWEKDLTFIIDDQGIEYRACLVSSDKKHWELNENGVNFLDQNFEQSLEWDLEEALENDDEEDAASICTILNNLDEVRQQFELLIPELLKLANEESNRAK